MHVKIAFDLLNYARASSLILEIKSRASIGIKSRENLEIKFVHSLCVCFMMKNLKMQKYLTNFKKLMP